MDICKVLDTDADYILFGTMTRVKHNPLNCVSQNKNTENVHKKSNTEYGGTGFSTTIFGPLQV